MRHVEGAYMCGRVNEACDEMMTEIFGINGKGRNECCSYIDHITLVLYSISLH